jgi:hypothetical protein
MEQKSEPAFLHLEYAGVTLLIAAFNHELSYSKHLPRPICLLMPPKLIG